MAGRRAVFLDRDGVLNELVPRDGGPGSPWLPGEFRVAPGAADAVRRLRERGWLVFVVTNQPEVARGRIRPADLEAMHAALRAAVPVDDVAVCPHDDASGCECRKPRPGLVRGLAARHGVDLARSFLVGDTWRDVGAGRAAGCRTIRLPPPPGGQARAGYEPDLAVSSLEEAVAAIEKELDGLRP